MISHWQERFLDSDLPPFTAQEEQYRRHLAIDTSLVFMLAGIIVFNVVRGLYGDTTFLSGQAWSITDGLALVWCLGGVLGKVWSSQRDGVITATWLMVVLLWLYGVTQQHMVLIYTSGLPMVMAVLSLPLKRGLLIASALALGAVIAMAATSPPYEAGTALRFLLASFGCSLFIWVMLRSRGNPRSEQWRVLLNTAWLYYLVTSLLFLLLESVWPVGASLPVNVAASVFAIAMLLLLPRVPINVTVGVTLVLLLALYLPASFFIGARSINLFVLGLTLGYFLLPRAIFGILVVSVIALCIVFIARVEEFSSLLALELFALSQLLLWLILICILPLWFKKPMLHQLWWVETVLLSRYHAYLFVQVFSVVMALLSLVFWPIVHEYLAINAGSLSDVAVSLALLLFVAIVGGIAWLVVEARAREQRMVTLAARANQASEAKVQFLSTLSHELRTPLNGIVGMLQVIELEPALPKKHHASLRLMKHSSGQLRRVVEDVIDISRLEQNKLALQPTPYVLSGLVEELSLYLDQEAQMHDVAVQVVTRLPHGAIATIDAQRILQFIELIASRFLVYADDLSDLTITFTLGVEGLAIAFESSSDAFESAILHVMQDIAQQDSATHVLMVRISELLQASLERHISRVSGKPRLELALPMAIDFPQDTSQASPFVLSGKQTHRPNECRLLIVDDDLSNRLVMLHALERVFPKIEQANDGHAALDKIRAGHFDLVITDLAMPQMSGEDLLYHLQAGGYTLPVIALTGNVSDEDVARFKRAGFYRVLFKPIDLNALRLTVEEALQGEYSVER